MKINDEHLPKSVVKTPHKINPVGKTYPSFNSLHARQHPSRYDSVVLYCPTCQKRMEMKVYHPLAKLEHYQLVNLPQTIAKHIDKRNIHCLSCDKDFVLEKEIQKEKTDFLLKLDCSNMNSGMESWYEDSIPKHSDEEYSL